MMTGEPCTVHSVHRPFSHVNHKHHVWPKGMGGPDIEENLVVVCPTGHSNIHSLLSEYVMLRGNVSYAFRRRYTRTEQKLARLGWQRYLRGAM